MVERIDKINITHFYDIISYGMEIRLPDSSFLRVDINGNIVHRINNNIEIIDYKKMSSILSKFDFWKMSNGRSIYLNHMTIDHINNSKSLLKKKLKKPKYLSNKNINEIEAMIKKFDTILRDKSISEIIDDEFNDLGFNI